MERITYQLLLVLDFTECVRKHFTTTLLQECSGDTTRSGPVAVVRVGTASAKENLDERLRIDPETLHVFKWNEQEKIRELTDLQEGWVMKFMVKMDLQQVG
ncbi:uncharacterized protein LOC135143066 [Zophobas morio]|uniref:uncharacterized protein LOC135143066 n=1 Tax=Zophobas morio TaxID=2755281 RepID=UPI003082E976